MWISCPVTNAQTLVLYFENFILSVINSWMIKSPFGEVRDLDLFVIKDLPFLGFLLNQVEQLFTDFVALKNFDKII